MDKAMAKAVFAAAGLEVLPHHLVRRHELTADPRAAAAAAVALVGLPCFCKPAQLGSSIGVARCASEAELGEALELALELDTRALVEPALDTALEINCAVIGRPGGALRASLCEQPIKAGAALTFEDKYLSGAGKAAGAAKGEGGAKLEGELVGAGAKGAGGMASADRIIPAPISDELAGTIREAASAAHRALGFAGVVRYDFLVEGADGPSSRIVLNEANTVPGSFSFYLFEPDGLAFVDLADELLEIARAEAVSRRATVRTFESALLAARGVAGS
jgi:D-alanine-D-alanine ligase